MRNLPSSIEKTPSDDKLALEESYSIDLEHLDKEAKANDHYRREELRWHAGIIGKIILWAIGLCFLAMIFCWIWNFLTPDSVHFLSEIQFERLQSMLFAATVLEALPAFVKKYLP